MTCSFEYQMLVFYIMVVVAGGALFAILAFIGVYQQGRESKRIRKIVANQTTQENQ